jgi:hypothetical protein
MRYYINIHQDRLGKADSSEPFDTVQEAVDDAVQIAAHDFSAPFYLHTLAYVDGQCEVLELASQINSEVERIRNDVYAIRRWAETERKAKELAAKTRPHLTLIKNVRSDYANN